MVQQAENNQNIQIRHDHKVYYLNHMGDDKEVVEDARTSILTKGIPQRAVDRRLKQNELDRITDFLQYRHASVLRGSVLKVGVETTIAMQRQIRTHWVGNRQFWPDNNWFWEESDVLGFNDQSGKYSRYKPIFYIPPIKLSRIETEDFDPMNPTYRFCNEEEYKGLYTTLYNSYEAAYKAYEYMNTVGISRELSRMVIPEAIYVSGRITMNLNAALGFMSMRIDSEDNLVVTKPQAEIQQIAEGISLIVQEMWPAVYEAWDKMGRTRP